jgi:hypothetical protein
MFRSVNNTPKDTVRVLPDKIINIVSKEYEDRTSAENAAVNKYLVRLNFFRNLAEHLSQEVAKMIMREGRLKLYN